MSRTPAVCAPASEAVTDSDAVPPQLPPSLEPLTEHPVDLPVDKESKSAWSETPTPSPATPDESIQAVIMAQQTNEVMSMV